MGGVDGGSVGVAARVAERVGLGVAVGVAVGVGMGGVDGDNTEEGGVAVRVAMGVRSLNQLRSPILIPYPYQ